MKLNYFNINTYYDNQLPVLYFTLRTCRCTFGIGDQIQFDVKSLQWHCQHVGTWIQSDLDIEVPADPVDLDTTVYTCTGGVQVTHHWAGCQIGQWHRREAACTRNNGRDWRWKSYLNYFRFTCKSNQSCGSISPLKLLQYKNASFHCHTFFPT